jgi:hypothetical protein
MPAKKIPGDRLVLATISVLRTLIRELSARGIMDQAADEGTDRPATDDTLRHVAMSQDNSQ